MRHFDVDLIGQTSNMTCWHAAMRMISRAAGKNDPAIDQPTLGAKVLANEGLRCAADRWKSLTTGTERHDCSEAAALLRLAGFVPVPGVPSPLTPGWLETNLPVFGPLLVPSRWRGFFHAVVARGVNGATGVVLVNDPLPVRTGTRYDQALGAFLVDPDLSIHHLPHAWAGLCRS